MPQCVLDANSGKGWFPVISTFTTWTIIFVFLWKMINLIISFWNPDLSDFTYTEFFINFEGGFVRRGLLGECLLRLSKFTGVSPDLYISIACLAIFLCVLGFFLREFKVNGYCWWLLFSPFLFGFMDEITRKDFILYGVLILILMLIRPGCTASLLKSCLALVLVLLALFIHEAFFFWGVPIFLILLYSQRRFRLFSFIAALLIVLTFCLLCHYSGDENTVHGIISSWEGIIEFGVSGKENAVTAIGWDTYGTLVKHFHGNFMRNDFFPFTPIIRLGFFFVAYYFISNCLFVFSKFEDKKNRHSAISSVFMLTAFCLLPMFLVLSCDYARLYQYISIVSITTLLIIPPQIIIRSFPEWYIKVINRFNDFLTGFLSPTKGLIWIILFFVAATPVGFSLRGAFDKTIFGIFLQSLIDLAIMILR